MARGMTRTTASRPSVGSSKKLTGSNEIKPFRDNESSDPYYDPQWDNPYQRESTPVNEDPKRKADRERQQRIDEKDWDSLTKKKKQEDFNLDLTGSVGFSHEIVDLGGSSISFTAGIDFLPGPDVKIKDGKASIGAGIGLPLVGTVNGGLVIDVASQKISGITGGLEVLGIGIDFSTEKCHTTVTITLMGVGITYGKDTCREEPPPPIETEIPTEPEPPTELEPAKETTTPGSEATPPFTDQGYGFYAFFQAHRYYETWKSGEGFSSLWGTFDSWGWGYSSNLKYLVGMRHRSFGVMRWNGKDLNPLRVPFPPGVDISHQIYTTDGFFYAYREIERQNGLTHGIYLGDYSEILQLWNMTSSVEYTFSAASTSRTIYEKNFLVFLGYKEHPPKSKEKNYPIPLITPERDNVCDLSPVLSLQRKANEMLTQGLQLQQQSAAAIGVGAFPATYPGSLVTNKGTKKVNNLAEQVDTLYDTMDELMGKYPQKHKVKRKNKDGKDEEMDFEIPNQSEGQAELLGMMMQSLQQTSNSNNMENRQLQELALTRQMVVKLYYMVESIMEYLDYPTETTVINLPMSITPMKRKGNQIEKLKEFGDMVKESIQPVIVTKKKSGDPETLKKYLLHLTHGAAIIKAAFWRKLSPENPKEQINANLAKQEKLSELSSTEKAWNEALEIMAGKLDPENEAEAKKNAPKIEVEKKPGAK